MTQSKQTDQLELGLELELTDFSEGSELLPAGDERAGATEAVALAGHLHVVDYGLEYNVQDLTKYKGNRRKSGWNYLVKRNSIITTMLAMLKIPRTPPAPVILLFFTLRPASLLWRFISWRADSKLPETSLDSLSRMSIKF